MAELGREHGKLGGLGLCPFPTMCPGPVSELWSREPSFGQELYVDTVDPVCVLWTPDRFTAMCTCVCVCVCMCVHVYMCVYVCVCMCVYVHVVCMCVCVCSVYVYM